ncbi:hypothetical protein HU830_06905 [Lactobacillus sp. DCY120]|uniref:Transposase n=1 Tax=Bombilactobacillus apium TaxID=2675299 RepID=A0A850R7Q2_9LACO|nr:hypothetical protein [Bombilactobacillus apium]
MNQEKLIQLLGELPAAQVIGEIPQGSDLTSEALDLVINQVADRLVVLEEEIQKTAQVSPNRAKQERCHLKSQKHQLQYRQEKMRQYRSQTEIYGTRNSYLKTDHDATFMRVKEDPMGNSQLKPAYNL